MRSTGPSARQIATYGKQSAFLAHRPDRSRDPSLRESHLSPHVSQSNVTSHSPRQNALPQARTPRRQAIPALLSRDCRLLRATGGLRRRFARICVRQTETEGGGHNHFQGRGQTAQNRTGRCVRSGRVGRAPSGERRADEMRRRSATRFGGKVAEGDRVATRERPRSAHAPRRTRGADRLPDAASWAGLRPAADLAVAARPSGRPSRPPGGGSTVVPKRAARRQATGHT